MSETDETPVTWRDNKTVLRLVRIGFILQFLIPAIVCIVGLAAYDFFVPPKQNLDRYAELVAQNQRYLFHVIAIPTLIVLAVQYIIFALPLRLVELRSAVPVLWCLIIMNIIHSALWILLESPLTFMRLTPPTILYIVAIYYSKLHTLHSTLP